MYVIVSPALSKIENIIRRNNLNARIFICEDTGDLLIYGTSPSHIESMKKYIMENIDVTVTFSEIHCRYRETISQKQEELALSKSPNKHLRIWMNCEPISDQFVADLQNIKYKSKTERDEYMVTTYEWEKDLSNKIWNIDLNEQVNILVDRTVDAIYMRETKDFIMSAFTWVYHDGPLCSEPVHGVQFNIVKLLQTADMIHNGGGQFIPMTRRCLYAFIAT
jgi:elongation factor 2